MSSFRQLLRDHAPLLVMDACSSRVQAGWLTDASEHRWAGSETEAGIGIFECLEMLAIAPEKAGAFVYCDGPGSLLGIRTTAMVIRAWNALRPRPTFSFHGLELAVHALGNPTLNLIADARRDTWHCVSMEAPLSRVPTSELSGELAMPEGFRNWTALPASVSRVEYSLEKFVPRVMDLSLLKRTEAPDAFLHEEPSYVTWAPHIHRAP